MNSLALGAGEVRKACVNIEITSGVFWWTCLPNFFFVLLGLLGDKHVHVIGI